MTLRHIRIFLAVCENGNNTTRAARALYLAQPAVSRAVAELEEYYGVRLFDRIGRRLYLTEAGRRMWEYAVHICGLFDDLEKGLRGWDEQGVLRVGASITIGSQFLPGYVDAFRAEHPGVDVRVWVGPSEQLEEKLLHNTLDVALMEGPVHGSALTAEEYMADTLAVVCAPGRPFTQGQTVPLDAFRVQRFLLREKGSGTREQFDSAAAAAGFTVAPVWESTSTLALVNAATRGLGVAVLPLRMAADALEKGQVAVFRVDGLDLSRKFRLVHHRDKFLTASAREFLALCRAQGDAAREGCKKPPRGGMSPRRAAALMYLYPVLSVGAMLVPVGDQPRVFSLLYNFIPAVQALAAVCLYPAVQSCQIIQNLLLRDLFRRDMLCRPPNRVLLFCRLEGKRHGIICKGLARFFADSLCFQQVVRQFRICRSRRANRRKAYAQLYRKRKPGTIVFLVCPKDRRVRVKQRAFLRCVKACMNFGFSRQRSQPRRRSAAFQLRVQKIFEPFVGVATRTDCSVYLAEHCSIAEICRKFNILACFFANRTHIIHARRFVRPDDPLITGRPDNVAFTRMVSPIMRGNFLFCIPGDQRISRLSPCPPYKSSQKNQRQQKRQRTRCFRTRNASPAFVRLARSFVNAFCRLHIFPPSCFQTQNAAAPRLHSLWPAARQPPAP